MQGREVLALKELMLCTGTMKNHDPKRVVYNHYKTLKMVPPLNMKKGKKKKFSVRPGHMRKYWPT
jgi:hypothetical protein